VFFNGKHIGGLELGPVLRNFLGDPNLCATYEAKARLLLGELKRKMQLGGIKAGITRKTLPDGVKLYAQSNMYGLADIDEIGVDVTTLSTRKIRRIASFTVYFKKHDVHTYLWNNIRYMVSEPYMTSGGAVGLVTGEAQGAAPQYAMGFYSSSNSVAGSGFSGSGLATGRIGKDNVYENTFIKDAMNQVIINEGVTNYGMFSESNTGFNHINTGYTLNDGYIGKVHCGIDSDTDDAVLLTNELVLFKYPFERFREPVSVVKERHQITHANNFLPGAYAIGANIGALGGTADSELSSPGDGIGISSAGTYLGDHGGATIVVRYSDGGQNSYDFDFLFEPGDQMKTMATTAIELNPLEGTLIEYPVTLEQSPFYAAAYQGTSPFDPTLRTGYTWSHVARRVIDKNIRPLRVIDLFE